MTTEQVEAQLDKIENMTLYASDRKEHFRNRSADLQEELDIILDWDVLEKCECEHSVLENITNAKWEDDSYWEPKRTALSTQGEIDMV